MARLRERVCLEIARRVPDGALLPARWRRGEVPREARWRHFSDSAVRARVVLDFGCGSGALTATLAQLEPRVIWGIELDAAHVEACEATARRVREGADRLRFAFARPSALPFPDRTFDTVLVLDGLEHLVELEPAMREWRRVLRIGGQVLIWWRPYRGPCGPQTSDVALVIPWGHLVFGQRALYRAAARRPRRVAGGAVAPDAGDGSSLRAQGYVSELTVPAFLAIARQLDLAVTRFEAHGLGPGPGDLWARLPLLGEFLTAFAVIELTRR